MFYSVLLYGLSATNVQGVLFLNIYCIGLSTKSIKRRQENKE